MLQTPETPIEALKAIPEPTAKEWVSVAYLEAVAAQAGLNTKRPRWDSGIDIEVGSDRSMFGNLRFPNLYISFQLKSTENWEVADGSIDFRVDAATYDRLRDNDRIWPIYLVLYTLPHSRAHWIVSKPECAEFRNRAYFVSLKGLPELRARADGKRRGSRTIRVPATNHLSAASLLRLYREACEVARQLGGAM
ncbi:MAG: DUF4365 domain-containing protein [Phycisphaerales bacterium]